MAAPTSVKDEALRLLRSLPDDATWDDVHYLLYINDLRVRGIAESADGKKISAADFRRRFGLPER